MNRETSLSQFKSSRVLITGHTGFKGSWLSLWLSELGAEVYGLSNGIPSRPSHYECSSINERVNDIRIDIRNLPSIESHIKKVRPDFVFHLAAQPLVLASYKNPIYTFETNTLGTINLLEALRQIDSKCVAVIITSDKCYENQEWIWGYKETDRLGGADPYSASKAAAEIAINCYTKSFLSKEGPLRLGIARAGNVIGGGDWGENRLVPDCMRAAAKKELITLRNPHSTRPWQHVLEPLSGYINLALSLKKSNQHHGEAFNFAAMQINNYTVEELVENMSNSWQDIKWNEKKSSLPSPHEFQNLQLNCEKARSLLHWDSVWDLKNTISNTVNWYRHFYEGRSNGMESFSIKQISDYVNCAKQKSLTWAL
ncbi:CDP-glucose 4,6-dehydratase [Prochlorococcus sp. MIT 1341]|uniref:CDP-glucose 4,6-dehydratase n=1 Tax=Prochlorococcus sp. MIT 1341 TaxID=3096221 RepID=UPI002A7472F6|nr:CDP-glucose 4,6-dehydratase [Prochlorococcus sp. MIT 1341]